MSSLEEKKQLQKDAGIPFLPTDLTYKLRQAIAGHGKDEFLSWGYQWTDKPHRLVFAACAEAEAAADEIERLRAALERIANCDESDADLNEYGAAAVARAALEASGQSRPNGGADLQALMQANNAIRAREAGLVAALRNIAEQKKSTELEKAVELQYASFEDGYDACIDVARAALEASGQSRPNGRGGEG